MNFYATKKPKPDSWYDYSQGLNGLFCCAAAEAQLDYMPAGMAPKTKVEKIVDQAMWNGKTWLHWYLLKGVPRFENVEEIVKGLPCTTFLGEYKNLNSDNTVRAYVTNLQQEW